MSLFRFLLVGPVSPTCPRTPGAGHTQPEFRERIIAMSGTKTLKVLLLAIANGDHDAALNLLGETPSLAITCLARSEEFFLAERLAQVYEGDTALHAAGFSYDSEMARKLTAGGADIRAKRIGVVPSHRTRRQWAIRPPRRGTRRISVESSCSSSSPVQTPTPRRPGV